MRAQMLSAFALAASLLAGCSSSSQQAGAPTTGGTLPQTIAFSHGQTMPDMPDMSDTELVDPDKAVKTFTVGLATNNTKPYTDKTYGRIYGIFKGTKAKVAHVVVIPLGRTVVFDNVDSIPHTGTFLGDASKNSAPWPTSFSGGGTQSPAGTDISSSTFSTGVLQSKVLSPSYTANVPGFYMFGCGIHYNSLGQRNIIIVQ